MSRVFQNFKDASLFAKEQSINLKTLHTVKRTGNNWVVLTKNEKYTENLHTKKELVLQEKVDALERRLERYEQIQREEEREKKKRKVQRKKEKEEARLNYLKEKREEYTQLPVDTLKKYANKYLNSSLEKELNLDEDEEIILREILDPYVKSIKEQAEKDKLDYLKERKEYYLSLSEEELDKKWAHSDQLISDEKNLLRSILRHAKGYDSGFAFSVKKLKFCPTCFRAKEDCKCKEKTYHKDRPWW